MQRIKWPTVQTDVGRVAVDFHEALAAIMARLAQALQRSEEKLVHVAMMRLDMIRDRRRHHLAAAEAEPNFRVHPRTAVAVPMMPFLAE